MYASDFVLFVLEAADSEKYIFAIWLASELTAVLATANAQPAVQGTVQQASPHVVQAVFIVEHRQP